MTVNRLKMRPEAQAVSVEKLVQWVKDGKIRLPKFQRGLRWKATHVRELFDSIFQGYPIGGLLFSHQKAGADSLSFGALRIDAGRRDDAFFVIDGQQRITSLAGALLHPEKQPRADIHAIWFDVQERRFEQLSRGAPKPTWIPLNVVVDSVALMTWLDAWPLKSERRDFVETAFGLGKAIREYQIPAYILHDAQMDTLRVVFKRTNRSGVEMTEDEVFNAINETEGVKPLDSLRTQLESTGFGSPTSDWLLRCVKVISGTDLKRGLDQDEQRAAPAQLREAETAIQSAIKFLVDECGVPHIKLLPYRLPLLVLSRFFSKFSHPKSRSRTLLVRWFWRGAISGRHSNTNQAVIRSYILATSGGEECEAVERILALAPDRSLDLQWLTPNAPWRAGTAHTNLVALSLLGLRPIDPKTGDVLDSNAVQALIDPLDAFPSLVTNDPRLMTLAVAVRPTERNETRDLVLEFSESTPEVLGSHALSKSAIRTLRAGDVSKFTEQRERLLLPRIRTFLTSRAGLEDDDRPAISDIVRDRVGATK